MTKAISGLSLATMMGVILAGCSAADAPETAVEVTPDVVKEVAKVEPVKVASPTPAQVSETRSADSHTHGAAALALVLENGTVTAEFESPLYNLLGFEHSAETKAQKGAVKTAEDVLSRPAPLFVFNAEAICAAKAKTVSVELGLDDHAHDNDPNHKHDDDHKDDHDHKHESDHDHADHDHSDHSDHKDVILSYEFTCQNPDDLTEVTVNLFDHFENLAELDLVYLGPNTQKQARLSANNSRASLTW